MRGYLVPLESGQVVGVGQEVGHLFTSMLQVHPRVESAEFVVLLALEVGLLAQQTHFLVSLLEAAHEKPGGAEECLHHLSYYYPGS
jgi:hypothetical protein